MNEAGTFDRRRIAAGTGLSLGAALGMGASADAATFEVTNLNDSGAGSLREAINAANANPADADQVLFQAELTGTLALGAELDVYGPVEIVGPGADQVTIQGGVGIRHFYIAPAQPSAVRISDLTLAGGNVVGYGSGGSIVFQYPASLTLERMVVRGNRAAGSGGGGIFADGSSLTVRDSTIADNVAEGTSGGGILGSTSQTLIENTTISGNTAAFGGGLALEAKYRDATVRSSTIVGNTATVDAGGLSDTNFGNGTSTLDLVSTIVADNTAQFSPNNAADMRTTGDENDPPATLAFNLIETTPVVGGPTSFTQTGPNLIGEDPALLPLADTGGPTPTHALAANSPARDKGNAFGFDQRGAPRPFDLKGPDSAAGGNGADIGAYERVLCGRIAVNEIGTEGDDRLVGGPGKDGILGLGGKDKLRGRGGKDGLCGNGGKDRLLGGGGNDRLLGGRGNDVLNGGKGNDTLKGGRGKDKKKS